MHHTTLRRSMSKSAHPGEILKALVPIADGTEEIEAVTVIDTLVRAGISVRVASVTANVNVVCSRGVKLSADCLIEECLDQDFDVIVCPGGMPGAQHLSDSEALQRLLRRQADQNKYIAAICASPAVVLAKHNFLTDKTATGYPAEKFINQIPHYSSDSTCHDGNIITSQGPGTALPFALRIVEALCGHEKAIHIRNEMIWHH